MSFSDFYASDLSDITSSSEDDAPPAKVKKPSARKPRADQKQPYTITQALRPPRSTSYSVRSLYEQIVDGGINLDPDYQRDVVWTETKQIGLIDSVIRNYYIPPLIFAVSTSQDGSETRICIDGKQRLTSIQKFMDGLWQTPPAVGSPWDLGPVGPPAVLFAILVSLYRDHITAKRYWWKKHGANAKALLPKTLQQAFANKQIVCVEYDGLTSEQEREIFQVCSLFALIRLFTNKCLQRVQLAERMQAISGPWPSFIREIQSQVLGDDGFGHSFEWGRARGKDFHGLASIVYLIEQLPACRIPPTSAAMDRWLTRTTPVTHKLRTGILDTFRVYLVLVREKDYRKPFTQRVSPIEFVMIGVMIYMKRETLSLTQLSHAVEKLRADVRSRERDVRTNGRTTRLLFKFIMEKLPKLALRSDGQGDKSAQSVLPTLPRSLASTPASAPLVGSESRAAVSVAPGSASAPHKPKKRKRQVEDDGDDDPSEPDGGDEDEYVPSRRRYTRRAPDKAALQHSPSASPRIAPASAPVSTSTSPRMPANASTASNTPTPSLTEARPTPPHLAALRGASTVAPSASTSASVPPTPVVSTHTLPLVGIRQLGDSPHPLSHVVQSDQPALGTAVAPIDLDALEKLQQILTFSAGINAVSNTAQQQQQQQMQQTLQQQYQTQSQLAQLTSMRQFQLQPEQQDQSNLGRVMALQQLQALLAMQPPQQLQQLQQLAQPQQGQTPSTAVPFTVPPPQSPVIKAEYIEPSLKSPHGWQSARPPPPRLEYRRGRSRSRSRERDYDRHGGNGGGGEWREREYSRRGPVSYPLPSRSRSRSRSESRSHRARSPSRSRPADLRSRIRSRSRSISPERGYHNAVKNSHRVWDQQQAPRVIPSGPRQGPGPGPGPGPNAGFSGGSAPNGAGRRPSSPSSMLISASSPAGIARKFEFTRREQFGEPGSEQRPMAAPGVPFQSNRGRGRGRGRSRGRARGGFRGSVPGGVQGTTPGSVQGTSPGSVQGTMPGSVQGSVP
ncbi:hypothetical protein EDB92DRAFT_2102872 [Lactarius akahatsu]|uniref:GmrSD restriction endonucleases N-terminal domain-containing protein n=1 Tax=Lactarius akahatsu TaxID=416441 RepID=A0AAD4L5X8_9AGAM|nr:hypothetical protein EDB92DRAFT_2106968 [Lactarius akahatsu]KAH8993798.1 hypothetical protein EDB92DRAFT_2102872 [Lactarius akahatsu]